jgi:hypothetical protein
MIILFDYYFKTDDNMAPNKHFNSYKEGLGLEFLQKYCMEHGELHGMERGKTLEDASELSGLVKPSVIHLDNPNNIIK